MSNADAWRLRCPEGHAAIETYSAGYRCSACEEYYDGEPLDAADTEFPAEQSPAETPTIRSVVRALYFFARDTDTTAAATDLGARARTVGKKLQAAREAGLVERIGASSPYRWRLTRDGYNRARPLRNSNVTALIADERDEFGMSPVGPRAER